MKSVLKLVILAFVTGSLYLFFRANPPIYKKQIVLKDSANSVQDSMKVLRQICESVEAVNFMNCYINPVDSVFVFNTVPLGKFDSVSVSNKAFEKMKKNDVIKLLSIMKFLNQNLISGIYHDISVGFWLYSYGEDLKYNSINYNRVLFIWDEPKDTLSPTFKYYYTIIDRKNNMVLLSSKDVPYKR